MEKKTVKFHLIRNTLELQNASRWHAYRGELRGRHGRAQRELPGAVVEAKVAELHLLVHQISWVPRVAPPPN